MSDLGYRRLEGARCHQLLRGDDLETSLGSDVARDGQLASFGNRSLIIMNFIRPTKNDIM
jgi:hypothetical protein